MVHDKAQLTAGPARAGRLAAAALVASAALAGCSLAKKPTPSLAQLRAEPVTAVQYPASTLVADGGNDSNNNFGPNAAVLDRTRATKDPASTVLAFFDSKLKSLGWTLDAGAGVGSTSWSHTEAWRAGTRTYEVGIDTPEQAALFAQHHPNIQATDTVFETLQQ